MPNIAPHLGQHVIYKGEWCAIANLHPDHQVWLISLERKDSMPFLVERGEELIIPLGFAGRSNDNPEEV